ncbi:MM3350-like domain-containing protein, partial [Phlyctochytrium arcticum]
MHAGSGFMAIMLLQMIKDQAEDVADDAAGDVPLPVPTDLADHLIDAASAHLDKLEAEPHLTSIYRLKITLEGVEPTVWRTLEVKSTTTLGELREYIMMAFGWCGAPNTHEFAVYDHGLVRFTTIPDDFVIPDEEDQEIDERHEICEDEDCTEVGMVVSAANDTFTFTYEKGDWVHHISVESVREEVIEEEDGCCSHDHSDESAEPHEHKKPTLAYPKLVDGAHACPPDEVGGPAGYKSFLSAISTNAPAGPFTDRISALTFAADHVGFSNSALDSWPGATKRSLEDLLSTEEPSKITEVTEDESTKDLTAGGWKPDAFDLTEVGKALDAIANMMAEGGDDEDDWESDEEEEAEESGDDV